MPARTERGPLPCDDGLQVITQKGVRNASRIPSNRRQLPRAVVAAAHLVLAFAIFCGIAQSGSRYFYCEALGLLPSDPCADAARDGHSKNPLGTLTEHHADCCEIVTLAVMPQAAQAAAPSIAPAALVATLPALCPERGIDSARTLCLDRPFEKWRPPPRASNDARAQLMVFLI